MACSEDGLKKKSGDNGERPKADVQVTKMTEADLKEISQQKYSLNSPLHFKNAKAIKFKEFEGTDFESVAIKYLFYFHHQKSVTMEAAAQINDFCIVSTDASENTPPEEIFFEQGQTFLNGQIASGNSNDKYWFEQFLEAGIFQGLFLECHNTPNVEAVKAQVGHIFNIEKTSETHCTQ